MEYFDKNINEIADLSGVLLYNPYDFNCYDSNLNKDAYDLYINKGYVLYQNFFNEDECNIFLNKFFNNKYDIVKHHSETNTETTHQINFDNNLINKILTQKIKVGLQPNSDSFLLSLYQRNKLNKSFNKTKYNKESTKAPDNLLDIVKKQTINEGLWWRIMNYKNGQEFRPHVDGPGEIMAILYLTEKNTDYSGGLHAIKNNTIDVLKDKNRTILDIDGMCKKGDLILLNGHKYIHWVEPVYQTENKKGRVTLFIPGFPKYG